MGVKTSSLFEDEAVAKSLDLDGHMRVFADRLVTLHPPKLYVET